MAAAEVQIVSQSNLQKIESFFNDSAYREAIENSANFNTRLCVERRLRMPFLDPQTGVAQTHCNLFMHRRQRMPGFREGQLYTYPAARWRKAKRQYLSLHRGGWGELGCGVGGGIGGDEDGLGIGSGIGMGRDGEGGMEPHDTDSKDSHHKDDGSKDWFYDDMAMEEMDAFEEPEPDSDEDYCDESYSARKRRAEKEKGLEKGEKNTPGTGRGGRKGRGAGIVDSDGVTTTPKGRGRGGGRGRKKAVQQVLPYEVPGDADKPYGCERMIPRNTLPVCGARYKTRPGLTYHYTHSHKEGGGGSDGDSRDSPARGPTPSAPSTLPPIVVPPDQPSTEYQDSYVTFITGNRRSMVGSTATTTGSTATSSTTSTNNTVTPSPTPASSATSAPAASAASSSPARTASPSSPKTGPGEAGKASPYCDFCLGDQSCNKKTGVPEELVSCSDCGRSGHPTCLQFTDNMIVSVRKYRWQCIECKCCSVCGTSDNDDQLLFCDDCDRGYHMYCLTPPLAAPPEGSWSCALCIQEFHTSK